MGSSHHHHHHSSGLVPRGSHMASMTGGQQMGRGSMKRKLVDFCIISLPQHNERRDKLKNEMAKYDIECRVSHAIDGRKLLAEKYFSLFKIWSSKMFGRGFLTPSELGCFLSHKKALTEFLASGRKWLVVLEDDVLPKENVKYLDEMINSFCSSSVYILGGQDGLKSFSRVIMGRKSICGVRKVILGRHRWLYRTCCYCVDIKGAERILRLMEENSFFCDDWSYIVRNAKLDNVFYGQYFSRPVNLNSSSIEAERLFIAEK